MKPNLPSPRFPLAFALALFLLCASATGAWAATTISGDDARVAEGETIEGNLYLTGDVVAIDGVVTGDVIAAGRRITLGEKGRIGGDLLCAAANIYVEGALDGDLRCAGYTIEVLDGGRVGGEVTAAGFGLHLSQDGRIDGEVLATGAQAVILGEVGGDLRFAGAGLEIDGRVDGDVVAVVAGASDVSLEQQGAFSKMVPNSPAAPPRYADMGLTIGPEGKVTGALSYESPVEAQIPRTGVDGTVTFEQVVSPAGEREPREPDSPELAWFKSFFQSFAALLLFGALLLAAMPRLLHRGQATVVEQTLPSAGWGLLTVVVAFAGIFVLLLGTLIGLIFFNQIGLPALSAPLLAIAALTLAALTMGTLLLSWVGRAVVVYALGRWTMDRLGRAEVRPFVALLLGTLILALLGSIPYAGGAVATVAALVGLGAVITHLFRLMSALRSDAAMVGAAD